MTLTLTAIAQEIVARVESIPPTLGLTSDASGRDLRADLVATLRLKVIPELEGPGQLPVLVAVQGGTNTGKSTVFNALAGRLLSPAIVQASATKHPLVFAHERWRRSFLARDLFPGLVCRELADPKELLVDADRIELLYFRFHEDDSLSGVALIDSPDFDSTLETNLRVATTVSVLSDVTVFVTTQEKYRDRELVAWLRRLRGLKAHVLLVFNKVAEEIVFTTLLDDLRQALDLRGDDLAALRVPSSASQHPEDEVRERLRACVLEKLRSFEASSVKPLILNRTLRLLVEQVRELIARFAAERTGKESILARLRTGVEEAAGEYVRTFDLALPEETLAVRWAIRATEVGPWLRLPDEVLKRNRALAGIAHGLRGFNDTVRRLFLRISRSDEGAIDETAEAATDYARARNEMDHDRLLRLADRLRLALEEFLKEREAGSALCRELLAAQFGTESRAAFPRRFRRLFEEKTAAAVERSGETVFRRVREWCERHPAQRESARVLAVGAKVAAGVLVARWLPPDGFLHALNWCFVAAGYFAAAYAIALALSILLRRKRRFRRARVRLARELFDEAVASPLEEAIARVLCEDVVLRLDALASAIAEHRDARGDSPAPLAPVHPRLQSLSAASQSRLPDL